MIFPLPVINAANALTPRALTCQWILLTAGFLYNLEPDQGNVSQFSEVLMQAQCNGRYGMFHADLALYSVTPDHYCSLFVADDLLRNLAPQDGTLIEGSQRVYEAADDGLHATDDPFDWLQTPSLPVDINLNIMPCATWYYTDPDTNQPVAPPSTVCTIAYGHC